jgi:TRAP-type mannitol/chloroaromatic compound transport system permease large subunit
MKTLRITSMIMAILLGGTIFTGVFFAAGGIGLTNQAVGYFDLSPGGLLALLLAMAFLAGFVLDWISILLILIPIFMPLVKAAGFNPVWFCILFLIIIQTSYLTPPMAPAIFYLRGIAPPSITLLDMYKGVIPFIVLQALTLAIIIAFPQTVLWLPTKLLGFS